MSARSRARSSCVAALAMSTGLALGCDLFEESPTAPTTPKPTEPPAPEVIVSSGFEAGGVIEEQDIVLQTPPEQPASEGEITDVRSHSGARSLRLFAGRRAADMAAKAALRWKGLQLVPGDVFQLSGYFWFPDNDGSGDPRQHRGRFLMDLECLPCALPGSPGVRLQVNDEGFLRTESKWTNFEPNIDDRGVIAMSDRPIAVEQWLKITWRVTLGNGAGGNVTVLLDDQETINANGTTIAPEGAKALDHYDRFQIGLTANGRTSATEIYMDDVLAEQFVDGAPADSAAQSLLLAPRAPESEPGRFGRGDRPDRPPRVQPE